MRAKGLGAKVIVTEIDPVKALEAYMDGFEVMTMNEAAKLGDFFVTVTGCRDIITERDFAVMKDGAICCNAGHFDIEVDVVWLRANAVTSFEARHNIIGFTLPGGQTVYVIAEGRLVNLAAGDGHPAEIMDMSFAIQALSAAYLSANKGKLSSKLIDVPREIDSRVAELLLKFKGLSIDTLTEVQKEYIKS
jgi:adenosylhomocysteinase